MEIMETYAWQATINNMCNSIRKYVFVTAIRTIYSDNRIQNREGKERREESRQVVNACLVKCVQAG